MPYRSIRPYTKEEIMAMRSGVMPAARQAQNLGFQPQGSVSTTQQPQQQQNPANSALQYADMADRLGMFAPGASYQSPAALGSLGGYEAAMAAPELVGLSAGMYNPAALGAAGEAGLAGGLMGGAPAIESGMLGGAFASNAGLAGVAPATEAAAGAIAAESALAPAAAEAALAAEAGGAAGGAGLLGAGALGPVALGALGVYALGSLFDWW